MSEYPQGKRTRRRDVRSRSGCSTCRRRKVKCDEVHPKCGNCVRLKLDCSYTVRLLWEDEAKRKGIAFGRSKAKYSWHEQTGIINDNNKIVMHQLKHERSSLEEKKENILFMNVTAKDFGDEYEVDDETDEKNEITKLNSGSFEDIQQVMNEYLRKGTFLDPQFLALQGPNSPQPFYNFPFRTTSLEENVFKYGIESIFPGCICYFNQRSNVMDQQVSRFNPYLNLIVPLAHKYHIVFKTLVAASSKQLYLLGNEEYGDLAHRSLQQVLSALPRIISDRQKSNSSDWDEVMVTILMLCFIDISSSCGKSWLIHLNGAKVFIKGSLAKIKSTPLSQFFTRYFLTHEIMGETAWSGNNLVSDDTNLKHLKYDNDQNIDLVLGCSPCLISVIKRISSLGEQYEDLEGSDETGLRQAEILTTRDNLEDYLCSMDQQIQLESMDDESVLVIKKIAEVKKLTSLVYLFARVDMEEYYFKGEKSRDNFLDRYRRVREITKEIIRIIESLPVTSMTLLWTLFVIGIVSVEGASERLFVSMKLTEVEKLRELASVKTSRRVVESVWNEQDSKKYIKRWKFLINGRASTISLA